MGKLYFEKYLGVYHATSSKHWSTLCKSIFLVTYVAACNLLQLMVFELLDMLPPASRRLAWSTTFSILCLLLNVTIPFVGAASVGRTLGLRRSLCACLGAGNVLCVQIWLWVIAETFITDHAESWKDHSSTNVVEFLVRQLLFKDIQHSIALIAMMGTVIAAVVAGFATVAFPLEQLIIMKGVKHTNLDSREATLLKLLGVVAKVKRNLTKWKSEEGIEVRSLEHGEPSSFDHEKHTFRRNVSRNNCEKIADLWRRVDSWIFSVLAIQRSSASLKRRRDVRSSITALTPFRRIIEPDGSLGRPRESDQMIRLNKVLVASEIAAKNAFRNVIDTHELRLQGHLINTAYGKGMWIFGISMSIVAISRLLLGLVNTIRAVIGDNTYYIREESDIEYLLAFVKDYTGLDFSNWNTLLHIVVVGSLGLMQIRAFLGSMMRMAKLGLLSTNTELYALVLAYLSGLYFLASIVLLRTQLPLAYRKGVTVALGPFDFAIFSWIFDCLFVLSAICSVLYISKYSRYSSIL